MTRSLCLKMALLLSFILVGSASIAADVPATPVVPPAATNVEQLDDLDEIWVRGKSLSEVIEKAEDDFFKLYNKLNKDSQYDVYCGRMALNSGSMLMIRQCTPGFVVYNAYDVRTNSVAYSASTGPCYTNRNSMVQYHDTNGDPYYMSYANQSDQSGVYPYTSCMSGDYSLSQGVTSALLLMEKRPAYEKNVRKVISSDPRLLQMVRGLSGLYDEMDLAQRHYVKVKAVKDPPKVWKARSTKAVGRPRS